MSTTRPPIKRTRARHERYVIDHPAFKNKLFEERWHAVECWRKFAAEGGHE